MDHSIDIPSRIKKKNKFTITQVKYMFLVTLLCGICSFFLPITRTIYFTLSELYGAKVDVDMETCKIPELQPFSENIKSFVYYPQVQKCMNPDKLPLDNNRTHIWIKRKYVEENGILSCCYQPFSRPAGVRDINKYVDNRVHYKMCTYFTSIIVVRHEFVNVKCNLVNSTIEQYFLFTPFKQFIPRETGQKPLIDSSTYNVLMLGIDAVSRLNFFRTMPKTVEYLKNMDAIDLSGYNKVGDNTFPNVIPMLMGISVQELNKTCLPYSQAKFDNCPFIWEWFKQAGYYTAFGEDGSYCGTFDYMNGGFASTPTDYYMHTFINEAEQYSNKVINCSMRHGGCLCLNEKYMYKVLLDYVESLTVTLKSLKLFGFFWEMTMTHSHLNYPMIMDDDYVNFLKNLEGSGYLNNSIIFLLSDHGIRWGAIRHTQQGRLEERLPFMFVLVPQSFRNSYSEAFKNLQSNMRRLTTPYDIHATLVDLLDLQSIRNDKIASRSAESYGNSRSISLFLPIPTNRTCEMAAISDHWCTCHRGFAIPKKSKEAKASASFLVTHMNSLLKDYEKCATLSISEIKEVIEMVSGVPDKKESGGWREFLVILKTSPGGGVFEGTVKMEAGNNSRWSVSGTVSRLNLYAGQSDCVHDRLLKLYCYCTRQNHGRRRSSLP